MNIPATRIPLDKAGHPNATNHHEQITSVKTYLARIHGQWFLGTFSREWYGWSFDNWGSSGIQLNGIDALYSVDISALDDPEVNEEL